MSNYTLPDTRLLMPDLLEGRKPTGEVEIEDTKFIGYFLLKDSNNLADDASYSLVGGSYVPEGILLDGISDYFELGQDDKFLGAPCSFYTEFTPTRGGVQQGILFGTAIDGANVTSNMALELTPSNEVSLSCGQTSNSWAGATTIPIDVSGNTTYSAVGVISNDGLQLWVAIKDSHDYSIYASVSVSTINFDYTKAMRIGNSFHYGNYFQGTIGTTVISSDVSDEMLKKLRDNPYQFLKPKSNAIMRVPVEKASQLGGYYVPDSRMLMPDLLEGRKPVGEVEIDWGHPCCPPRSSVAHFMLLQDRAEDIIGNLSPVASNIDWSTNSAGISSALSSSIALGDISTLASQPSLTLLASIDYVEGATGGYIVSLWGDAGDRRFLLTISSTGYVLFGVYTGSAKWILKTVDGYAKTGRLNIVATWKQETLRLYVNGKRAPLTVDVWTSGTVAALSDSSENGTVYVGRHNTSTASINTKVYYIGIFNSYTREVIAKSLSADPYQFLVPK